MNEVLAAAVPVGAAALVALVAWLRRSLTGPGAALAVVLAAGLWWAAGWSVIIALAVFFGTSTVLTHWGAARKAELERAVHARTGRRGVVQVAANGVAALLLALAYRWSGSPWALAGAFAAFAASTADTWASELGQLEPGDPVSILGGCPVERGMSGGVTVRGMVAAAAGSALMALLFGVLHAFAAPVPQVLGRALLIWLAGFTGSVLDSVLGAALQAKYRTGEDRATERPAADGQPNRLVGGWRWVTNDVVNAISSCAAALPFFLGLLGT